MQKMSKIYVSGHTGMVGQALMEVLKRNGYTNIITRSKSELDLLDQKAVREFFEKEKPEYVFHLAAKVGGILGNKTYPADFSYENLQINTNIIYFAHKYKVKKLINFGSICIYPVNAKVPVKEEYLLTGPLEYSNEGYAVAKISGLMLCKKFKEQYGDNFISVMPDNIYGINDNFHPQNAHVIPMLMRRFHEAKVKKEKEAVVWGTGNPTRGFIFSEDVADGLLFIMKNYNNLEHINIGTGIETKIKDLADLLKKVIGFEGKLRFDKSKPDGTPRRYLDVNKLNKLGWTAKYTLEQGLVKMYKWFKKNEKNLRER